MTCLKFHEFKNILSSEGLNVSISIFFYVTGSNSYLTIVLEKRSGEGISAKFALPFYKIFLKIFAGLLKTIKS